MGLKVICKWNGPDFGQPSKIQTFNPYSKVWPNPVNLTIQNPDTKRLGISHVRILGHYCLTFVYLSVDDGGQAEVVEDLSAISPDRDTAVLPQTLVVKSVHLSDLTGLVVPTDQGYPVRVPNLEKQM